MESRLLFFLLWTIIIINGASVIFTEINIWLKVILFFIIIISTIWQSSLKKKDYSNTFLETLGLGVLGGIVVSLFEKISDGQVNSPIIMGYIVGFIIAFALITIGKAGKD